MYEREEIDEDILRFELAGIDQVADRDDHDQPVGDECLGEPFEDVCLVCGFLAYV